MKYEYKTLTYQAEGLFGGQVDSKEFDASLNKMGAEGWELVNCIASNVTYGKTAYIISIFKRPVEA